MSQSQQEFKDRMASRLQNVLARLAASAASHQPTVPTVGPRPAPNDKPMVRDFPQTDRDQVNDPTSSTSEVTMVSVAPSPPVADVHPTQIDTPILSDVPLVRARRAEGFDHTVGVQSTLAGIDGAKVHFSNVVKQANTNLRSEGDLAANIAITLGQDATEAQEATVTAVSGRIATARMAVRKGATASRVPLAGMDVRLSVLRTVAADERAWPDHTPVYIPSGMSDAGAAALTSLLVDGGPGAYVWRYPGGTADAAAQPSGVRWQWPGGTNRLLVVTENDRDWNVVFGGQSFTESALMEVEDYYRRAWGDGIFDEGWRTAFSLYGVYFSPKDLDLPVGLDFDAKQVRQDEIIDGRNVDFDFEWAGPSDIPDPPDDNTRGIFTSLPPSYTAQLGAPTYRAWVDAFGDRFGEDRPDPLQYASYSAEARGIYYVDQGGKRWLAEWEHLTDEAMEDEGLLLVTRRARQIYLRVAFGDGLRNPDEAPPFDPQQTLVRNVFGQNDRATLLLPRLRLVSVLALLSGISVTVPGRTVQRWLDNGNMDVISKAFGAHQHFAFIYSLSAQLLDPGTLRALPMPGAVGMLGVPPELRSACVPRMMSEAEYPWGSHECLENGGIFQTFRNTPFAGFAVEGTWNASGGYVKVADPGNSYPAIDAAARATWASGGTIDVHTRLRAGVSLSVVFSLEKLPNPFGVPRFVQGVRGVEPLTVQSGAGVNTLLAGRSMDPFLWATW